MTTRLTTARDRPGVRNVIVALHHIPTNPLTRQVIVDMVTAKLSKEQLIDRLRKDLTSHLDLFLSQKTTEQAEKEAQIDGLNKTIASMSEGSPGVPALQAVIANIQAELDKPGINEPLRKEAAIALIAVCNDFRLPLQLKQAQPAQAIAQPTKSSRGTRKRLPKEDMQLACDAIIVILPPSDTPDHLCMAKGRVADKTDLDAKTVSSALIRLNRQGLATSNGIRGAGGGWRKLD